MTSTHPETQSLAQDIAAQAQQDAAGAPGQYLAPSQALLDEIGDAVAAAELSEPRWLVALRRDAAQRFAAMGFPTPKHEDWHYTSTASIAEADGPQVRVQLMGEKLLAFRNTDGKACLISEFCSHRGVSLYFGRNEENGIRCAYHGVKFDGHGKSVDVPSSPQSCARMHIKAYPCIERGGIVWTYMGPEDKQPALPEVEWCTLPAERVFVS